MKREICFDTETTGLDPLEGHRIVEIGCVEMIGHLRTGKTFHTYLNPQRDMPPAAEKIHGLSEAFLRDKPVFAEVAANFVEFVGDAVLVAHNAAFDMKFINHELQQAGFASYPARQSLDTLALARKKFPGQPSSLDALCRRFAIDLSARTKHGALLDAELLADVYLELLGGRQSSFGLAQEEQETRFIDTQPLHHDFPQRQFSPSYTELQAHKMFVEHHIKSPIWAKYFS